MAAQIEHDEPLFDYSVYIGRHAILAWMDVFFEWGSLNLILQLMISISPFELRLEYDRDELLLYGMVVNIQYHHTPAIPAWDCVLIFPSKFSVIRHSLILSAH